MNEAPPKRHDPSAWWTAVGALARHLSTKGSTEGVADAVLLAAGNDGRGQAEWLLRGALRDYLALEKLLRPRVRRSPGPTVWAALCLAVFEMRARSTEKRAAVVNYAVGQVAGHIGRSEASFANAVLRRVAADPALAAGETEWARAAHPDWLAQRWEERWGRETVEALLRWNQLPAPTYLWMPERAWGIGPPEGCSASAWPGFFLLGENSWPAVRLLLEAGNGYIRDPMTQPVINLPSAREGMTVLDLCAAPGGKAVGWVDRLAAVGGGRVFAVDLPGERVERLRGNLARAEVSCVTVEVVAADILSWGAEGASLPPGWPHQFDLVVLDAPCSNTGVLRRRPDAKIRLQQMGVDTMSDMAVLQRRLLDSASSRVSPGGQLLYATCSLEEEENEHIIDAFCAGNPAFYVEQRRLSLPWVDNHDGGGAFLLTRLTASS